MEEEASIPLCIQNKKRLLNEGQHAFAVALFQLTLDHPLQAFPDLIFHYLCRLIVTILTAETLLRVVTPTIVSSILSTDLIPLLLQPTYLVREVFKVALLELVAKSLINFCHFLCHFFD